MSLFQNKKIYLAGFRKATLDQARGRLVLISIFFIFVYVLVVARSVDISLIQGELRKDEGQSYEVSYTDSSEGFRSDITDRNGIILARSLKVSSLYVDPALVEKPAKLAKDLKNIFPELGYGSLLQKVQGNKRFSWIKRNLSPEQQAKILYLGYPELGFKEEMRRVYPQGSLVAHMVGATGIDGQGLVGLESSFDNLLRNKNQNLELTIDIRLQHVLKREIEKSIKRHHAKGGAGIIMDVSNGEVLSAVSLPDYDPHLFKKTKNDEKFNKTTLGVYELGSTFKIFSTAAYLESQSVGFSQTFDVREPLEVGRFKIRDYHPEERVLTLPEVFVYSSNIGSAMMGQEIGSEKLRTFYKDLGLLSEPDFEINEVGKPLVPSPWRDINTLTASYGHGIAVSPLQLATAVSTVVNGGVVVNPTIVAHKKDTKKMKRNKSIRVISPQTSHRMRQLMRLAVTQGTGGNADVKGFLVGGKTGTAEKSTRGGYDDKRLLSSFIGVFPMDDPKYVVFIMVDEPKGIRETYGYATGGWVAAPAVGRVISSMVSILGMKPKEKEKGFERDLWRYVASKEELKKEQDVASH